MPVTWDIHAGGIEGGPMKKVATIFPVHPTTEASQWGSGFTDHGRLLRVLDADLGGHRPRPGDAVLHQDRRHRHRPMPTQVGDAGISRWTLNAAGTKWFYLQRLQLQRARASRRARCTWPTSPPAATRSRSEHRRDAADPGGTTRGVGTYQVLVGPDDMDKGLGLLVNVVGGRGNYKILNNPAGSPDDAANVISVVNDIADAAHLLARPALQLLRQGGRRDGRHHRQLGDQERRHRAPAR